MYTDEELQSLWDIHNFSFTHGERLEYLQTQEFEAEKMLAMLTSVRDRLATRYESDELGESMHDLSQTVDEWGVSSVRSLLEATRNEIDLLERHEKHGCKYC